MTPKEAIRRIENHIECHSKKERFAVHIIEALKMAVEALEKQTPKKPIEKDWVAFDVLQERDWFCPDCDENMLSYGQPYCGVCGQAIDWGDTE